MAVDQSRCKISRRNNPLLRDAVKFITVLSMTLPTEQKRCSVARRLFKKKGCMKFISENIRKAERHLYLRGHLLLHLKRKASAASLKGLPASAVGLMPHLPSHRCLVARQLLILQCTSQFFNI
ncbi:hypothetical protein NPIL_155291 [Nephila pilipes]|uniref:Uncharacterized protein n=1 Tax=Nephila pilipes TaxID=299642 RepID=A0A8X6T6N2_NEPPI|nr:hypothetical protein NPIL_155291 [Nephila pilipes]